MAYIEIYNEKVRDLLEQRKKNQPELTSLEVRESADKKIYVEGLWRPTVTNCDRIRKLIDFGNNQKQVSETKMNEKSSRSHSILQFTISQVHDPPSPDRRDIESVLTIVDLAGSERQSKSEAEGRQFDEMKKINHSLLMLGRALNSFSDGKATYVPLRDSRLTRLLSDCFGGNSRLWMLACVSPSAYNAHESISTLEYAQNAKAITNSAHVNSKQQRLELQELREQHEKLLKLFDEQVEKSKRLEAENKSLREEVASLRGSREEAKLMKRKVTELEGNKTEIEIQLNTAREAMLNAHQQVVEQKIPRVPGEGTSLYIGRAKVSLRNIIEQSNHYGTLPLLSDMAEGQGAALVVNIYPVDAKGSCKLFENEKRTTQDLIGHRVDFVVHIIKATGIPRKYTHSVYCKYVYKWAEKDSYRTPDIKGQTVQEFDFKKRFAFTKMNQGLVDYFMSDSVITFEVIGHAATDGAVDSSSTYSAPLSAHQGGSVTTPVLTKPPSVDYRKMGGELRSGETRAY